MVISLPARPTYQSGRWRLISNKTSFASPITRTRQDVARVGSFWAATMTIPKLRDPVIVGQWIAFFLKVVEGDSFYLSPPAVSPSVVTGTPRINGAAQTGQLLDVDGFGAACAIKAGTFFCFDTSTFRELHAVVDDGTANGSGVLNDLSIRPMIRKSPADNALLNFTTPSCEMTFANPDVDVLSLEDALWNGYSFDCIEAVRE